MKRDENEFPGYYEALPTEHELKGGTSGLEAGNRDLRYWYSQFRDAWYMGPNYELRAKATQDRVREYLPHILAQFAKTRELKDALQARVALLEGEVRALRAQGKP